jgi:hypothetical protein
MSLSEWDDDYADMSTLVAELAEVDPADTDAVRDLVRRAQEHRRKYLTSPGDL